MAREMQIRGVTVEFLRPGPAHNQLLSPLTQYLAVCGDGDAGVVTQPYEQATFIRRMKYLRYESGDKAFERLNVLQEMGRDIARVLGNVPCLPGALTADPVGPDVLIRLRLVLSASELASLPFELSKVPVGPAMTSDAWLSLQTRVPVVITRRTRNGAPAGMKLPTRPRILFVAARPGEIPFDEHRDALLRAIQPFRYPGVVAKSSDDGRREQFGDLLTILRDARFEDVVAECATTPYTHIHVLAHGKTTDSEEFSAEFASFGLELHNSDGESTVISPDRLASAFTRLVGGAIQRPTVVTLATCDSGNEAGSVLVSGASLAHTLHQAGIPLVVASQVPLSKEGSRLVVNDFYRRMLWGENPWIVLHELRSSLHGSLAAQCHDWASLVVYEALPGDLGEQLEEVRYAQTRRALDVALEIADRAQAAEVSLGDVKARVEETCTRLPINGRFAMECLGLRASSHKRLAEVEFKTAMQAVKNGPDHEAHLAQCCRHLDQALRDYEQAVDGFLVNHGNPVQRVASLHWVLVQQLSLSAILGKASLEETWQAAKLSALAYLDHTSPLEQAWAHGSLAELCLLQFMPGFRGPAGAHALARRSDRLDPGHLAREHVCELVKIARRERDLFPIDSTRKQFQRYVTWWTQPEFTRFVQVVNAESGKATIPGESADNLRKAECLAALASSLAGMLVAQRSA